MMNEINYALAYAKQEKSIRVVIISAKGDVFCAGADLSRSKSESNVPKLDNADDISLSLRHLYKPVICKIQGSVLAGALLIVTNSTHAIAVNEASLKWDGIDEMTEDGTIVFTVETQKALRELLGKNIETLSTETAQDQANDLLYVLS